MKKIYSFFFSLTSMGVLLLVFAAAIAVATFIGNDFGSNAAHALIYNATWFDILLALLAANLVANVFREKMYRKGRFGMLIFHVAFLVILLGAAITRFVSFEGMLHLRNGQTANTIVSDKTYVQITAKDGQQSVTSEKAVLLSQLTPTAYHDGIQVGNKRATFKAVKFFSGNNNKMSTLVVRVQSGGQDKLVTLKGGDNFLGEKTALEINGIHLVMSYGAKEIQLPFSIKLNRFELKRYPGSRSPSSFASWVTVIDQKNQKTMPFHIYMNHVLDYDGYRFFQSSYDVDEQGSILSVNHDYWGTLFTYLGYFLMALGMVLALMNRNSRFATLGRFLKKAAKTRNAALILMFLMLAGAPSAFSQNNFLSVNKIPKVNKVQAEKFGRLLVQSRGRFKPVNSLSSELVRKITGSNHFHKLDADQVLLGMMTSPQYWQAVPMIKINDKDLAQQLGIQGKYAAYFTFFDSRTGNYRLSKQVAEINAENPSQRSRLDNAILKVDEKMNICYMIYEGDFLKVVPNTQDPYKSWLATNAKTAGISTADSMMLTSVLPQYLKAISAHNYFIAGGLIKQIRNFQEQYGGNILPSQQKISAEIFYNKAMIFDRLSMVYGLIGVVMIILLFVDLLGSSKANKSVLKLFFWIIVISFIFQTVGLVLRWYISGHAPWSDGYESMIYIAWVTLLAGLIFSRRSMMTVAATTILSSIFLMVAHLSWMDPEITNLVPVLKSYWLTIHVSVITASYGFLALSALLGFLNLILTALKSPKNKQIITERGRELTAINERSLTIGLYMLTIGTFIGGVWANESWGSYWGWDPKETWALVSVLVYSFIAHMHKLPGLKSQFSFNLASLLGYSSILMTFFGVNYYLRGLHSYAQGDSLPIPHFVYWVVIIVLAAAVLAYDKERKFADNGSHLRKTNRS